jgi:hypothetical protein
MGLATFGLDIGAFCDLLYSVPLLSASLGLDSSGHALSWPHHAEVGDGLSEVQATVRDAEAEVHRQQPPVVARMAVPLAWP